MIGAGHRRILEVGSGAPNGGCPLHDPAWEVLSMAQPRGGPHPASDGPTSVGPAPRLNGVTPAQVASFMLDVGGRLVSLDAGTEAGHPLVVYTFEVAGKQQSFEVAVRDGTVESIAQLFPEAIHPEAALHERLGITFQSPGAT
jgi:hypothetical protein